MKTRLIMHTMVLLLLVLSSPVFAAAITSHGKVGDKYVFTIEGVTVSLAEGDEIDGCLVTARGLSCEGRNAAHQPGTVAQPREVEELRIEKEKCERELEEAERMCQERYIQNIKEFTAALKNKNQEILDKKQECDELRRELDEARGGHGKGQTASFREPEAKPTGESAVAARHQEAPLPETIPPALESPREIKRKKTPPAGFHHPATGEGGKYVKIVRNWSNIREDRRPDAKILSQGLAGDFYPVRASSGGWHEVQLDDGAAGWIWEDTVEFAGGPPRDASHVPTHISVTRSKVNIRSGPGFPYQSIQTGSPGQRFEVSDRTLNWLKIVLADGSEGWIHTSVIKKEE